MTEFLGLHRLNRTTYQLTRDNAAYYPEYMLH